MTTPAELKTRISNTVNKGDKYDDRIAIELENARKTAEMKNAFAYQERWVEYTIPAGSRLVTISSIFSGEADYYRLRSIKGFRAVSADGYTSLTRISPGDLLETGTTPPSAYWFNGALQIVLDTTPAEAVSTEVWADIYTTTPADSVTDDWLTNLGADWLHNQTMVNLAPYLRAPEYLELYGATLLSKWDDLVQADEEFRLSNDLTNMAYVPEFMR